MTDRIQAALDVLDKATPGPWEVSEPMDGFIHIWGNGNEWVCQIHSTPEKSQNNAILIAAAPDLAAEVIRLRKWQSEVLKRMEGWRDSLVETNDFGGLQYLDRLIAEAEGE